MQLPLAGEWPHLRSGEPGRRVEPGGPHEEDEQGAERELEGCDGVRQRQRQRAENLQRGTTVGVDHQGGEREEWRGSEDLLRCCGERPPGRPACCRC